MSYYFSSVGEIRMLTKISLSILATKTKNHGVAFYCLQGFSEFIKRATDCCPNGKDISAIYISSHVCIFTLTLATTRRHKYKYMATLLETYSLNM